MNPTVVNNCISDLTAQIALCQDAINALLRLSNPASGGQGVALPLPDRARPTAEAPRKGRRAKPVRTAPAVPGGAPLRLPGDKPDTLAGAMKQIMRALPAPFSQADLRGPIEADADFAALLRQAAASSFSSNLAYWVKAEKLRQTGGAGEAARYTITDAEWFAPKPD